MTEIENDFNNLDVDSFEVNSETTIYLVPVVAPIIREGKTKKSAVKNFTQTMTSSKIVRSFDLKVDEDNDDEPFKDFNDTEYVITDLNSLKNIKENKRFNCNFGLRYYIPSKDETKLFLINNDILEKISDVDVEDLSQKIDFNKLQTLNDEILDKLHLTLAYQSFESLEKLVGLELPQPQEEEEEQE